MRPRPSSTAPRRSTPSTAAARARTPPPSCATSPRAPRPPPTATGAAPRPTGGPWARWKQRTTQGAPFYPLGVLFGLNMVDELDRTAFGVLLPEIRDHFGLDNSGILTVVSLSLIAALILALPIGFYADRWRRARDRRHRRRGVGRLLAAHRGRRPTSGCSAPPARAPGSGRAVNDPVHNSLLADYYDIPARPRVYAVHRYANALGQFLGPLLGGLIAFSSGWRAPFVVFAVLDARSSSSPRSGCASRSAATSSGGRWA